MLSRDDLANYLNILKLQDTDLTTLELKQVYQAFQKLALQDWVTFMSQPY